MSRLVKQAEIALNVYLTRSEDLVRLLSQNLYEEAWRLAPWQRSAFNQFKLILNSASPEEENQIKSIYERLKLRIESAQVTLPTLWEKYAQTIKSQQIKVQQEKDRIQKFKTNTLESRITFETSV